MGLRMILTLEKCFTVFFDRVFNLSRKRKRRKKEKKKKRKKYDQKKNISGSACWNVNNTCNRFIKLMMLPRVLSESYIIIPVVTSV